MPDPNSGPTIGEQLANYQILGMAGAGGMGVVYRAFDQKLERNVALKFLPPELNASEKEKERFLKEARTASSLDHPNIGVIHGVEETDDGRSFIVMAFYEGESLAQKIRRLPLPPGEAVDIAIQMCLGLEAAHARNIVHRDIKPSNVMVTRQGIAKIVDFGLARIVSSASMTQTGGTTGTVGYMSPEQSLGKAIDLRTDVWALGVVLAEMLTGQNPFWHDSVPSIVVAILNEPPRPMPGVRIQLQQIVYRALSKDPSHRYPDCAEMRADLEATRGLFSATVNVDLSAPTQSLQSAQFQQYIEHASQSALTHAMPGKNRAWRGWLAGAGVAMLIALALLLVPSIRARLAGSLLESGAKHIAVLPFDNIGNDPANEPLAEGLMDSLAGKLSDLDVGGKSLWVVPSSEVRHRKITDPTSALRELGATVAVKGSIARDGRNVHLTVALIDTKNLRQIGSVSFEDPAGDLSTLQDEAVARLAKLMHMNVTAEMLRATGGAVTPAAYESYLKALGYIQRYDKPGNLDLAIASLQDATKTDPRFALAYAQLGEVYRLKFLLDQNPKWIDEATAYCSKAAELDDRLPAAFVTLGRLHSQAGKQDLAVQEFQHALQLNPRDPDALAGLARTYEKAGRTADAQSAFEKAAALRPDYWDGYNELGLFYDRQAKYQEAITQFQRAAELTPDNAQVYSNLAAAYLDRGDSKDLAPAEGALKKSIELSPGYPAYANLGALYYSERRFNEAAAATEKALQLNDQNYVVWNNLLQAYQWLGDTANANSARAKLLPLLEARVRMNPQDAQAHALLATLYAQTNAREKAATRIQSALALSPDDPTVLEYAGDVYEGLGNRKEALSYAEKALEKGYPLSQLRNDPDMQKLLSDPGFRPSSSK